MAIGDKGVVFFDAKGKAEDAIQTGVILGTYWTDRYGFIFTTQNILAINLKEKKVASELKASIQNGAQTLFSEDGSQMMMIKGGQYLTGYALTPFQLLHMLKIMYKNIISFCAFVLLFFSSQAQVYDWVSQVTGLSEELPTGIVQYADGSSIVCGNYENTINISTFSDTAVFARNPFLVKYDVTGQEVW